MIVPLAKLRHQIEHADYLALTAKAIIIIGFLSLATAFGIAFYFVTDIFNDLLF